MRLIQQIRNNYSSVSIIGLAKNAGKTVVLNYLISEASESNMTIGLTSTGRDGENIDLVTNTKKPPIFVEENTVVATAKQALLMSDAKFEILETTGMLSPMGEIIIVRVRHSGNMQIAGPVNTKEIKEVVRLLKSFGAEVVFVDGAIDRKAASSPVVTDSCIIATGAVISRDMKKVIEKTAYTVECFSLPQINGHLKDMLIELDNSSLITKDEQIVPLNIKTGITAGKIISDSINQDTEYIYVKGAITMGLLRELSINPFVKGFKLIIEDATKIFLEPSEWLEVKKRGLSINTLNNISVVAVTLNPVSPMGYYFDSAVFYENMKQHIKGVKIIDVVSGGEEN